MEARISKPEDRTEIMQIEVQSEKNFNINNNHRTKHKRHTKAGILEEERESSTEEYVKT